MRIVLDTNVLVGGLLNPNGAPGRVVDLILGRRLVLLYDDRILGEYEDILARPQLAISQDQATAVISFLRLTGERITALPLPVDLLPDPDDLPFVEVAISGKAEALITGNLKHFIGLDNYEITILSPARLIEQLT
jgi:putative PIN family toxin of toxin-antitoxin system